jgi:SAM-dependent methyltransferase
VKNILQEEPLPFAKLYGRTRFICQWTQDVLAGKRVLNIGCGFGWYERFCLEHGGVAAVVGLDVSPFLVEVAHSHLRHPNLALIVASALQLPFPTGHFDLVSSWDVVEHLAPASERGFFYEAARVLKPGGELRLSVPYDTFLSKMSDPAFFLVGHRHYSPQRLASLMTTSGLRLEEHFVGGGAWDLLAMWDLYLCKWLLRREPLAEHALGLQQNREYQQRKGFMTLFIRAVKK